MKKLLASLVAVLLTFSSMADEHSSAEAEVYAAVVAFNKDYGSNDVEKYFGHYADDVTLYFYGARQDVVVYLEEWKAMIEDGGAIVKNDLSDVQVRVLPGDKVAVATYFVDSAVRSPEGVTTATKAFETDVWQKIGGEWQIVSLHYTEIAPEE